MNYTKIYLIIIAMVILVGGGLTYYLVTKKSPEPIACTEEARLCPDGSSVGRTGANCEFATCPVFTPPIATSTIATSTDETANRKSYADKQNGYEFKYPENFGANVWHPVFWPLKSTVVPTGQDAVKIGCPDLEAIDASGKIPQGQKISFNNLDFSYSTSTGAAAGSLYSTYCFITKKEANNYVLEFSIRSHTGCYQGQCGAYCGTQYEAECRKFDIIKDVEEPIKKIVSTFKFITPSAPVATTTPFISSITPDEASTGAEVIVRGQNFSGFEGDKTVWIINSKGEKGIIRGDASSTDSLIKFKLPTTACQQDVSYSGAPCPAYITLVPGVYNLYTYPWGNESNKVTFTIK